MPSCGALSNSCYHERTIHAACGDVTHMTQEYRIEKDSLGEMRVPVVVLNLQPAPAIDYEAYLARFQREGEASR